jgi:hypothetical protein
VHITFEHNVVTCARVIAWCKFVARQMMKKVFVTERSFLLGVVPVEFFVRYNSKNEIEYSLTLPRVYQIPLSSSEA